MQLKRTDNWRGREDRFDLQSIEDAGLGKYSITAEIDGETVELLGIPAPGKGRLSGRMFDYELID